MELSGLVVILLLGISMVLMAVKNYPADLLFMSVLTIIVSTGIISPADALIGFSNEGVLTIGALFVVATGLRETGAIQLVINRLLGKPKQLWQVQARIVGPVIGLSAFMNNTPIVATFIPALQEWARRYRIAPSRLLIPLSYAAILGGTCTLIGTATNLILNGLLITAKGETLSLFEPALAGVPLALGGGLYLLLVGRRLLPDRQSYQTVFENTREYTIEMILTPDSPLVGKPIEEVGLRNLPGLFLVEIIRDGTILAAVDPDEKLCGEDRLVFTGMVDSIIDLQDLPGLEPAPTQLFGLEGQRDRHLVEAVLSQDNPLIGRTVKDGKFRNVYGAVILAVSRRGQRVQTKVGDIRLRVGDVLLMEAPRNFASRYRNSTDFLLVRTLSDKPKVNYRRGKIAWAILAGMVLLVTLKVVTMFQASLLAALAMIATRCLRVNEARQSIDWTVLIVIAASLGIAHALQLTGVAPAMANSLAGLSGSNPWTALIVTWIITWILTEVVTNTAAAALLFPVVISVAAQLEVSHMPFVMTVLYGASTSFTTPIGYQTNLMVYSAGGYQFTDFLKIGLPLNLIVGILTVILVPLIWPF